MASNRNNPQAKKQIKVKTIVKGRKDDKVGENKEKKATTDKIGYKQTSRLGETGNPAAEGTS